MSQRLFAAAIILVAVFAALPLFMGWGDRLLLKFFVGALAFSLVYSMADMLVSERLRRRAFDKRESQQFDDVYEACFRATAYPKALVEAVWRELAKDLQVRAEKLRPEDRFAVELSVPLFPLSGHCGMASDRLDWTLRDAEGIGGVRYEDVPQVNTVGAYVELMCRLRIMTSS